MEFENNNIENLQFETDLPILNDNILDNNFVFRGYGKYSIKKRLFSFILLLILTVFISLIPLILGILLSYKYSHIFVFLPIPYSILFLFCYFVIGPTAFNYNKKDYLDTKRVYKKMNDLYYKIKYSIIFDIYLCLFSLGLFFGSNLF